MHVRTHPSLAWINAFVKVSRCLFLLSLFRYFSNVTVEGKGIILPLIFLSINISSIDHVVGIKSIAKKKHENMFLIVFAIVV